MRPLDLWNFNWTAIREEELAHAETLKKAIKYDQLFIIISFYYLLNKIAKKRILIQNIWQEKSFKFKWHKIISQTIHLNDYW